ncbi:vitellogenin-3-like [Musca autumnalis]|uniref:vitellogenin-3-like n=1 Tax=Musca autumnalis TaxID=221902 RepID=UPI003CFA1113
MSVKIFVVIFLIEILSSVCTSEDNVEKHNFAGSQFKVSDAVNAACPLLGNIAKMHPLKTPKIDEVYFQLRTTCKTIEFSIPETKKLLEISEYDVNKTTVIFIPGWMALPTDPFVGAFAKAYNCRGGYNFVVLNTNYFLATGYYTSSFNTEKLGEFVAVGLKNMQISPKQIHLIGHSLGAHIAGLAGSYYQNLTGQTIERITGLDPARPCFDIPLVFPGLNSKVANFVDIVHSNPNDNGIADAIGVADFYPAGLDMVKPGCKDEPDNCSHLRSIYYYIETVYPGNEQTLKGTLCNSIKLLEEKNCSGSIATMGISASADHKGVFYVPVNDKSPYGMKTEDKTPISDKCGQCSE